MPIGPGKYDDLASLVMERCRGRGVVVIVFEGNLGSGFSVQADPHVMLAIPDILQGVVDALRADPGELLGAVLDDKPQ
jgi:hypothetical protein